MNDLRCESARERLPDLAGGGLARDEATALRAHLQTCAECADEMALLTLLSASRPAAPPELASAIQAAVTAPRPVATRSWWGLAAAAVAALALGIGVTADRQVGPEAVPALVAGAEESSIWLADDGDIAGAPTLGDLTDEALLTLLDEMGSDPSGGAA